MVRALYGLCGMCRRYSFKSSFHCPGAQCFKGCTRVIMCSCGSTPQLWLVLRQAVQFGARCRPETWEDVAPSDSEEQRAEALEQLSAHLVRVLHTANICLHAGRKFQSLQKAPGEWRASKAACVMSGTGCGGGAPARGNLRKAGELLPGGGRPGRVPRLPARHLRQHHCAAPACERCRCSTNGTPAEQDSDCSRPTKLQMQQRKYSAAGHELI